MLKRRLVWIIGRTVGDDQHIRRLRDASQFGGRTPDSRERLTQLVHIAVERQHDRQTHAAATSALEAVSAPRGLRRARRGRSQVHLCAAASPHMLLEQSYEPVSTPEATPRGKMMRW